MLLAAASAGSGSADAAGGGKTAAEGDDKLETTKAYFFGFGLLDFSDCNGCRPVGYS